MVPSFPTHARRGAVTDRGERPMNTFSGIAQCWPGRPSLSDCIIPQVGQFCPTFGRRLAYAGELACSAALGHASGAGGGESNLGKGCCEMGLGGSLGDGDGDRLQPVQGLDGRAGGRSPDADDRMAPAVPIA